MSIPPSQWPNFSAPLILGRGKTAICRLQHAPSEKRYHNSHQRTQQKKRYKSNPQKKSNSERKPHQSQLTYPS